MGIQAVITVELENNTFEDDLATELGRILRKLAEDIEQQGVIQADLSDFNGNNVGQFYINGA